MRILWNFACRSRKDKMFAAINNIIEMATTDDYLILMSLDADDPALANREVWDRLQAYGDKVKVVYGFSKGKIDAINRSVWAAGHFDIICNHSDDFVITKKGFDQRVIDAYKEFFPQLDGGLHFPDGYANKLLLTFSILGRKLYDAFGYVYHPSYTSLFVDNEFQDSIMALGKYVFINENWFSHEHAANLGVTGDAQLQHTESFYAADKKIYNERRAHNFDISRVRAALNANNE